MLAQIVRASLQSPRIVTALACLVAILGAAAVRVARFDVFPDFAPPHVLVQTEAPGLDAAQVEALVTRPLEGFRPIHMPRNTGAGVILAGISTVFGFAMIWHIWWMAIAGFATLLLTAIAHTFNTNRSYHIPAEVVAKTEAERTRQLATVEGA